ncbi:MAG: molecular chaperone [Anaerolineae bacterium]|nr:MAG: molecular chaperone [Anaerolineae bacterium]
MPLKTRLRLPALVLIALFVVVVAAAAVLGSKSAQAQAEQPIAFNHSVHVEELGVPCLYCHSNAQRGQSAGLPTLEKCQGCHSQIDPGDSQALQDLARYAEENKPIQWVPVALQPDFVYFSHRPHVNAGLNCESCHGDVGQMTVAEPQGDMNMGWCLSCHKKLAPERFVKLSDCATCHK